jgi:hypothetical protein
MKQHYILFSYPKTGPSLTLGRGEVHIHNNSLVEFFGKARTGSVNAAGQLINAIPDDRPWAICDRPVQTAEKGMRIAGGPGMKVRIYDRMGNSTIWEYTHYLFHFDEPPGGSLGCIVFQIPADLIAFCKKVNQILDKQSIIRVYINQQPEESTV